MILGGELQDDFRGLLSQYPASWGKWTTIEFCNWLSTVPISRRESAPSDDDEAGRLDMRFNTGGDYTKIARFASHLPDLVPRGRIYLLTGPQTFSAAITTTAFVKQAAGSGAIILGEPVGDRLTFYSEGNAGCLPHARLCVDYATGMHDYAHRCNDWDKCYWLNWLFPVQVKSLAPDETIMMTFADYAARRDPAFERTVALASERR